MAFLFAFRRSALPKYMILLDLVMCSTWCGCSLPWKLLYNHADESPSTGYLLSHSWLFINFLLKCFLYFFPFLPILVCSVVSIGENLRWRRCSRSCSDSILVDSVWTVTFVVLTTESSFVLSNQSLVQGLIFHVYHYLSIILINLSTI